MDFTSFLDIITVVIVIAVLVYFLSDPGAVDSITKVLDALFER